MPVFLLACNNDRPAGILDHDQMTAVLIDVHIVDGALFEVPQMPDSLYKYGLAKYQEVFKRHDTDSTQFKKSFTYYTNKPDQLFDIYENVVNSIKAKTDSSVAVRVKADSIERIKQMKLNELIAKRAADSIKRVNKLRADSARKKARADSVARVKKTKHNNAIPRK